MTKYLSEIKRSMNMLAKNEKTMHGRILQGILDVYHFLLKQKETEMCIIVDKWSYTDFLILRIKYSL